MTYIPTCDAAPNISPRDSTHHGIPVTVARR